MFFELGLFFELGSLVSPKLTRLSFHRAHCVPQEGGRVQGWESVCWGVLGIPLLENRKVGRFSFHVFYDRYEMHIQAFLDFINRKFIMFDPHLDKTYLKNIYSKFSQKTGGTKHMVPRTYIFDKFQKNESQIDKHNSFPGWFQSFLIFFEAFL